MWYRTFFRKSTSTLSWTQLHHLLFEALTGLYQGFPPTNHDLRPDDLRPGAKVVTHLWRYGYDLYIRLAVLGSKSCPIGASHPLLQGLD